ncbi:MAG TPA: putative quinol monooxygenase [Verrucomicrobiae bacterium]
MIHVIATIELHPGKRPAFLQEFHRLVPLVHAEDGCFEYGPTIDLQTSIPAQGHAREDVVTVVEKWADLPALEAHLQAPHMLEYRGKVKDYVVSVKLHVLQPA